MALNEEQDGDWEHKEQDAEWEPLPIEERFKKLPIKKKIKKSKSPVKTASTTTDAPKTVPAGEKEESKSLKKEGFIDFWKRILG